MTKERQNENAPDEFSNILKEMDQVIEQLKQEAQRDAERTEI